MSWADTRLKHLCVDSGQYGLNISADEYVDYGIRLIRTSDITPDGNLSPTEDGVFIDVELEKRHCLKAGDLLMSRSGTLGRSFIVPSSAEGCTFAGFLVRFRPRDDVDPRFIYYSTRSERFQGIVKSEAVSSTIQNFNAERYSNIPMCAPPLEEQRRIADFLDAETSRIDTLIRLQRQVLEKLDNRIGVQRDIEISRLAKLGKLVPLRRFVWSVDQGSSPQCDAIPAGDGEWGVLKVSCLRPGVFIPAENKRLPDGIRPNRASEVRRGDLLITRANTPQLVGATAVVGEVRPMLLLPDKIFRVRLSEKVLPEFIAEVAAGTNIRALCAATSNGASQSMANIRFEEVKAWPIPLVPLPDQRTFVAAMQDARSNIASLADSIRRQLKLLAERRQALITAAVTGQFDVSTASGRNATQGV
ncbi:restriction endonuclease subunit S [Nocardia cyriacigeorgica]|uniref:restriction endonuclease subunit S n=1 Tax=Nocardia cyriacigeorgica TaxID=135487 RepID=UPI0018955718|nr:restriction endonuclease subunit S [Nocardia cyriacigeorgica]MBF6083361.1 restriction endonuclease subunit S [Nocardia cyriacigeorgica]